MGGDNYYRWRQIKAQILLGILFDLIMILFLLLEFGLFTCVMHLLR